MTEVNENTALTYKQKNLLAYAMVQAIRTEADPYLVADLVSLTCTLGITAECDRMTDEFLGREFVDLVECLHYIDA
jgi:hypothetical protein